METPQDRRQPRQPRQPRPAYSPVRLALPRSLRVLVALVLLFGATATGPGLGLTAHASREPHQITFMTRNMDAGTDFGPVLAAQTFPELLAGVAELYAEVQAS